MSTVGAERKLHALIHNLSPNRMRKLTGVLLHAHVKSSTRHYILPYGKSGQYVPLSRNYQKQKLKKYGKKPILVATGRLKKSVSNRQPQADSIRYHDHNGYVIGTSVPYAIYLHSPRANSNMPERKLIWYLPEDQKRNEISIKAHILEGTQ